MEKSKNIIVADNQDITRVGILYILADMQLESISSVETKAELMFLLKQKPESIVILDYTLFDINSSSDLLILAQSRISSYGAKTLVWTSYVTW